MSALPEKSPFRVGRPAPLNAPLAPQRSLAGAAMRGRGSARPGGHLMVPSPAKARDPRIGKTARAFLVERIWARRTGAGAAIEH